MTNILFLIIDSLRADGFFGNNKTSQTPNIDSLINNGVYFEQAISTADATILSETSIFTGKYAFRTGIRSERFNKLNKNVLTYFDLLKEYDYNFYAYLPTISKTIGLFPNFENIDYANDPAPKFSTGIGEKIIDKFKSNTLKEPWLFYIHAMDLHFPIVLTKEFNKEKYGISNYERQISAIDNWIGRILEKINLEKTLFVITADHGTYIKSTKTNNEKINFEENGSKEAAKIKISNKIPRFLNPLKNRLFFYLEEKKQQKKLSLLKNLDLKPHEKRSLMEGRYEIDHVLFDDKLHIPLLFAGANMNERKIISQQVRSVDIFPTICELIEIPPIRQSTDGRSLFPLINGKKLDELPAYIESNPLIQLKSNDVVGVRTSKYKYFRDKNDPKKRIHLYDLENDPFEDNNIADSHPMIINKMEKILYEICKDTKDSELQEPDDLETTKIYNELKKLGYV